jgi:hypothetical protein
MQLKWAGVGMLASLLVAGIAAAADSVYDDFENAALGPIPGQSSGGSTGSGSWLAPWAGLNNCVVENTPGMASGGSKYVHASGAATFMIRDFSLDPVTTHSQDVRMAGIDFERVFMMSSLGVDRAIQAEVYFVGANKAATENGAPPGADGTMWVFNGDGSGLGHGHGTWQQLGLWKGASATGGLDASQRYVTLQFADIKQGVEGGAPGTYDILWGNVLVANDVTMLQDQHALTAPNFHIVPGAGNAYIDNIIVTPEPAALALLALGGLFLRRRRA